MQPNLLAVTALIILSLFNYTNRADIQSINNNVPIKNTYTEVTALRITGETANAYLEKDVASPVVTAFSKGTRLKILNSSEDWYQVTTANGPAWVRKWLATPTPENEVPKKKYVVAYYAENYRGDPLAYTSMQENSNALTALSPFLYQVSSDGNIREKESSFPIYNFINSKGLPFIPIIHNHDPKTGFDKEIIHNILVSPEKRGALVNNILKMLQERDYQGINIDFENLYPEDRAYLNLFMKELWEKLEPNGFLVTMSVPAKTNDYPSSDWIGAHDYGTLSKYVNYMMIMTYDEHNSASSPGPIASIGWVKKVIEYALSQMPPEKILLGIAGYGYDWDLTLNTARTRTFSNTLELARSLAKEKGSSSLDEIIRWDTTALVPHITYIDSNGKAHEVWFENARSLMHKLDLVNQYRLSGIAIWRLGLEDPEIWQQIQEKLR